MKRITKFKALTLVGELDAQLEQVTREREELRQVLKDVQDCRPGCWLACDRLMKRLADQDRAQRAAISKATGGAR